MYEVAVTVRAVSASGNTAWEATVKDAYSFGDNVRWELAGAISAVQQEAARLVHRLTNEATGDDRQEASLSVNSGTPRRVA